MSREGQGEMKSAKILDGMSKKLTRIRGMFRSSKRVNLLRHNHAACVLHRRDGLKRQPQRLEA